MRLINGKVALLQKKDPLGVVIEADYFTANRSQTNTRDEANVTAANDRNAQGIVTEDSGSNFSSFPAPMVPVYSSSRLVTLCLSVVVFPLAYKF